MSFAVGLWQCVGMLLTRHPQQPDLCCVEASPHHLSLSPGKIQPLPQYTSSVLANQETELAATDQSEASRLRPAPNTLDNRSQPVSGSVNSWEVLWPIRGESRNVSANGRTVFVIMWHGWKQTGMVLGVTTLVIAELSSRWHIHSSTMTCYDWYHIKRSDNLSC